MTEPYELLGTHHVELYVGNARQASHYYQTAWGFRLEAYRGLETGSRDLVSYVLRSDRTRLVLTSPIGPGGSVNTFLDRHGDGVRDIAFLTTNVEAAFASATAAGALPVQAPVQLRDEAGTAIVASVRSVGDVLHSFVQADGYSGAYLPGFAPCPADARPSAKPGLACIDHIVLNVPDGEMLPTVDWYQRVFGFHRYWSADDKDIRTEFSSLRSIVVANANERVRMPINEPAPGLRKSQIQEYLDYNGAAGVQHVAFRTHDILATVGELRARGVEFLTVPPSYYEQLGDRVGSLDEPWEMLREHQVLVDRDDDGYLLQIFTKPVQDRPTLFYEVIQRRGSESFGKGNFKALFEAIEREQARRGNL